jgi:phosphoribosylformylglycinamidine cyclo-ligase
MTTYDSADVSQKLGDDASKVLYEAAKLTWENRKGKLGEIVELFSDFSGLRGIHVGNLPADSFMSLGFDGVGTKVELGERLAKHDTVVHDLFAMVCDDAVVRGAEPVLIGSVLDVNALQDKNEKPFLDFVKQLGIGYVNAA